MAAISKTDNIACTITDSANTATYFSGASIEIPASGTGNNLYFEMPSDTNLWLGKKNGYMCLENKRKRIF